MIPNKPSKSGKPSRSTVPTVPTVPTRTAPSNLRALTPTKPIRETYTLIPGVKVTVVSAPDRWPRIKKDGAYVSIDAAPAEPNATRDNDSDKRQSSGRGGRAASPQQQQRGDPSIPGATVTESLPGDDNVADSIAAGMDLTPESVQFLKQAERSILRKEEL